MINDLNVLVGTSDLRAGLSSVMVHASDRPKNIEQHQVMLDIGPENIAVTATDGMSAGLAIVSVHANNSGVLGKFAIIPDDASKILSIFKAGAEKGDEPQFILQLILDDEDHLTIIDQSGLMPGRSLRIPIIPKEDTATERQIHVVKTIAGLHSSDPTLLSGVTFPGRTLARFKVATAAYRNPIQVKAVKSTRALLVSCGESFLGALMPVSRGENEEAELERWSDNWAERLPQMWSEE